ncbi:twin-arginine translocase subunit TatC [Bacillus salipaludis]|uniref:twin-arginine translocase subunit TatC n=1 Tax=Bacillus salipaludis TaxID=2547811 RepID=UPI002E24AED3|nr:twin-arginine translocase subunit TatC [Bacillus salipaludis]
MEHQHLLGHLEELRSRIIKTLVVFVFFLIVSFCFAKEIYLWLVQDMDRKLAILGPSDILWIYMVIAAVISIALTIPVAAYQIWRFVSPALKQEEKRVTLRFIPGLFLLFLLGISFGYFVLFPMVLKFLTSLSDGQFVTMFTAEKYFRFMINIILPFGFLFEMPLVVMFLTRLGILNPKRLAKARKFSYLVLIVIAVVITPPDFLSDFLVTIPLLVLYELSITLSRVVYRKKLMNENVAVAQI